MFRALTRLVLTYAVTRMMSRAGRRGGLVDSVFGRGARSGPKPRARTARR